MSRAFRHRRVVLALALGLAAAPACRTAEDRADRSAAVAPPARWTDAFQREAVLVADEIVVEGPPGLIEHLVLRQDPETTLYSTKTVPEGLVQELVARPEAKLELRGQLDAWSLAAFKRILVLQRPGDVPVTVSATGKAYWAAADGSGERRQEKLVFQGVRGR